MNRSFDAYYTTENHHFPMQEEEIGKKPAGADISIEFESFLQFAFQFAISPDFIRIRLYKLIKHNLIVHPGYRKGTLQTFYVFSKQYRVMKLKN